ncbi:MAG TPA: MtrB/PioB family outer membrane beta-barrel protein, partial [Desulfosalsimonadaceae bacterium]|nr:MtrB/PioB family outer membrane beta-barrel protein [Desulfosalsimonadaceae bacterium]
LSNQPTLAQEISADINWAALHNLSVNANYRYTDEENDETEVADWEQRSHMPSLNIAYMPLPQWNFSFSYIYDWTETETLANIPVFDG